MTTAYFRLMYNISTANDNFLTVVSGLTCFNAVLVMANRWLTEINFTAEWTTIKNVSIISLQSFYEEHQNDIYNSL